MNSPLPSAPLDRIIAKAAFRIIPFLLLMYVLAFLDRVNVGFAKNALKLDTGLTDDMYAFGAGIFFVGYALFEIPSNLILHRVGARLWMSRIMVTWGIVSAACMFAHSEFVFYVLRFLLGVAEAGFFPGIIYFLAQWFPSHVRPRVFGLFYFGAPLAFIFGSPLSGLLLDLDGTWALRGWQWLFLVEGVMASTVGLWAFWYLDNKPADARWLSTEERQILERALVEEDQHKNAHAPGTVLKALTNGHVLFLSLLYFLIQMSVYGVTFYLPTQVARLIGKEVGFTVGLVTAIPWVCALLAAYAVPRFAERLGRHAWVAFLTFTISAAGIAVSVNVGSPLVALIALCFAAAGFIGAQPLFWNVPTSYLSGAAAASGLALINSLGALGGFVAPNVRVWAEKTFVSQSAGMDLLAAATFLAAVLFLALGDQRPGS